MNIEFKTLVGGGVAPGVGCFTIEEEIVVVVKSAISVEVNNLNGSRNEVVRVRFAVAYGEHIAGGTIEADVVAFCLGKSRHLLG